MDALSVHNSSPVTLPGNVLPSIIFKTMEVTAIFSLNGQTKEQSTKPTSTAGSRYALLQDSAESLLKTVLCLTQSHILLILVQQQLQGPGE